MANFRFICGFRDGAALIHHLLEQQVDRLRKFARLKLSACGRSQNFSWP